MSEPEGLEKVHVHNRCAGGHDHVHHVVPDEVHVYLHAAGGARASREGEDDGAFAVGKHPVVDFRGDGKIAGGKGHLPHGFDKFYRIYGRDVDVLNRCSQQVSSFHTLLGNKITR